MFTRHAPTLGRIRRVFTIALALVVATTAFARSALAGGVEPAPAASGLWVWIAGLVGVAGAWLAIHQVKKHYAPNKQSSTPPSMGGAGVRSSRAAGTEGGVPAHAVPQPAVSSVSAASGRPSPSPPPPKGRIFISYRRDDSGDVAGRVYDWLVERFGKPHVFKDVDSIPLGVDFRKHLQQVVESCDVLLAIIGADWMRSNDAGTAKRLDDAKDFVRIELESALQRNIPVIPVLVRGAEVPRESDLPPTLGGMAYRNGIAIRPDPDFHRDMDRLIEGVEHHLATEAS